jgi:hypothetical protein
MARRIRHFEHWKIGREVSCAVPLDGQARTLAEVCRGVIISNLVFVADSFPQKGKYGPINDGAVLRQETRIWNLANRNVSVWLRVWKQVCKLSLWANSRALGLCALDS